MRGITPRMDIVTEEIVGVMLREVFIATLTRLTSEESLSTAWEIKVPPIMVSSTLIIPTDRLINPAIL